MTKFFSVVLWLLFCNNLFAQNKLTLNQAIVAALKNNCDAVILKNKAEIANINRKASIANFLPQANFTLSQTASLNNLHQQLSSGSETKKDNVTGSNINPALAVNWTLFDGMKMFATKSKLEKISEIGTLNYKDTLQTMVAQTIVAYYDIVSAKQQLTALNDAITNSTERAKLAEIQFKIGTSSKVDWLQALVDLNEKKSAAIAQQKLIEQKKAELNRIIAIAPEQNFETDDSIPLNDEMAVIAASQLEQNNLQLKVAMKNIEVSKFVRKEIFSNYLPELSISGAYQFSQTKNSAGFTLLNQVTGWSEGIALNVPLFHGTLTKRQVQVADINVLNAETTYKKIHLLNQTKYFKAQKDYEKAIEILKLEQENILLANENLKIAQERYRLAQSTAIELRQAEQSDSDALTRLLNIRFATKVAETEMLRLMGKLVSE